MVEKDCIHTNFMIAQGAYYCKMIPFGQKKVGGTYQQTIKKIFKEQIRRNIEVCVDDMIVKRKKEADHFGHLVETLSTLTKHA